MIRTEHSVHVPARSTSSIRSLATFKAQGPGTVGYVRVNGATILENLEFAKTFDIDDDRNITMDGVTIYKHQPGDWGFTIGDVHCDCYDATAEGAVSIRMPK